MYFPSILISSVFSDLPFSLPSPQNKVKLGKKKKSTFTVSIKSLKDEAKNINLYWSEIFGDGTQYFSHLWSQEQNQLTWAPCSTKLPSCRD